jgi:hypothetical protein
MTERRAVKVMPHSKITFTLEDCMRAIVETALSMALMSLDIGRAHIPA